MPQIFEHPVQGELRARLIDFSTEVFLQTARRAECVRKTKPLWNADKYINSQTENRDLPYDVDQLEYEIEATMIHHVLSLLENYWAALDSPKGKST